MPDNPRATLRDIAADTGVSVATVSRVLNDHVNVAPRTRDLVLQAVERLKLRAAEPVRARTVYLRCPYVLTDYFGLIVSSIAETLKLHGLRLLLDAGESAQHSEVLAWAQSIRADVASHRRDLPLCVPTSLVQAIEYATPLPRREGALQPGISIAATPDFCHSLSTALSAGPATGHGFGDAAAVARDALHPIGNACAGLAGRLEALAATARRLCEEMEFGFLFDPERRLFSVGYRIKEGVLDNSYYDLLASESRLASFIAIAKGDVAATHWFRLGRPMTPQGSGAVLMSWSGSMFEYLMPSLVMFTPSYSLLDETCHLAVKRQIAYGRERHLPWGVSESAYNVRDRALTYQYADFGIPELGLKRGLAQHLVIAPYATLLAAMYDTRAAVANFKQLDAAGGRGIFGYYDAIDFTPSRLPENRSVAPVRAYMTHHQGMSLVALGNVLFDDVMRRRFHRQPIVRAADLLLQEPRPREVGKAQVRPDIADAVLAKEIIRPVSRRFHSARQAVPSTHLLSNGRYAVMVTTAGSGYSVWDGLAVTRWREDVTCDAWGSYIFLRDTASGDVWSATYQPLGLEPDRYEVVFSEDRARFVRHDGTLSTCLEIIVSPEDNAEIRRLTLTNSGAQAVEIELTSYAEVVLAPMAADATHPAFSNLFIHTEYLPEVHGLLAMRRPHSATDAPVWAAHILAGGSRSENVGYETDRARFLGRGHPIRDPVAIMDGRPLSDAVAAGEAIDSGIGLTVDDVRQAAASLEPGTAVLYLLFEHTWATGLKHAVRNVGGVPIVQGFLTPEAVLMVGAELEAMLEAEATIELAEAVKGAAILDALITIEAAADVIDEASAAAYEAVETSNAIRSAAAAEAVRALILAELIEEAAAEEAAGALVAAGLIEAAALQAALEAAAVAEAEVRELSAVPTG